jgi:hypothetical protein
MSVNTTIEPYFGVLDKKLEPVSGPAHRWTKKNGASRALFAVAGADQALGVRVDSAPHSRPRGKESLAHHRRRSG